MLRNRLTLLVLFAVSLALTLIGCGGDNGTPPLPNLLGTAQFVVDWPTRVLPAATASIRITILDASQAPIVPPRVYNHPTTALRQTISFDDLPSGPLAYLIEAFPGADASGTLIGTANGLVTVTGGSTVSTSVNLVVNSTVNRVTLNAQNPSRLKVGGSMQLLATAWNLDDEVVLVDPDSFAWGSSNLNVAIAASDGFVSALTQGVATITVTDQESQQTASIALVVSQTTGTGLFTVTWPTKSKKRAPIVPVLSVRVVVYDGQTVVATGVVNEPLFGGSADLQFDHLPARALTYRATAFPYADADGAEIISKNGAITVAADAVTTVELDAYLPPTLESLTIAGAANNTILTGRSAQLAVSANYSNGSTVALDPTALTWASSDEDVLVFGDAGEIIGVAPGTSTVTVTDTGSGMSEELAMTVAWGNFSWSGSPVLWPNGVLNNTIQRPTIEVPDAERTPAMNGYLWDPAWHDAARITTMTYRYSGDPTGKGYTPVATEVRLLWDANNLYVRYYCQDADIRSFNTIAGPPDFEDIYWGDVTETFIDAIGNHTRWYELQVNPDDYTLHAIETPNGAFTSNNDYQMTSALDTVMRPASFSIGHAATRIRTAPGSGGSVTGWLTEFAIPTAVLDGTGHTQFEPMSLRANFVRRDYIENSAEWIYPDYNWAPALPGSPHNSPEAMGHLTLVDD